MTKIPESFLEDILREHGSIRKSLSDYKEKQKILDILIGKEKSSYAF